MFQKNDPHFCSNINTGTVDFKSKGNFGAGKNLLSCILTHKRS